MPFLKSFVLSEASGFYHFCIIISCVCSCSIKPIITFSIHFAFSWLLGKHPIFVRTSHEVYVEKATQFIEQVVAQVKDLQFFTAKGSKGGPIIMTQVCTLTTFTEFLKNPTANFVQYLSWILVEYE